MFIEVEAFPFSLSSFSVRAWDRNDNEEKENKNEIVTVHCSRRQIL